MAYDEPEEDRSEEEDYLPQTHDDKNEPLVTVDINLPEGVD